MAYNQKVLDQHRADALAGRPFKSTTCPYCNGERDATVKHAHPSTKPKDPWAFWQHVLLDKYRAVQSPAAQRNTSLRFPSSPAQENNKPRSEEKLFVVGPMVDQSELPFRMLCRQYGANLAYTPMLHAKSFAEGAVYRKHFLTTTPIEDVKAAVAEANRRSREQTSETKEQPSASDDVLLVDRPCIVQFCGHDADTVLQAARYAVRGEYTDPSSTTAVRNSPSPPASASIAGTAAAEEEAPFFFHCDAVDVNLGCPQGIAKRGHYGSFLMEDWELVHTIIHTLHVELEVPVTVKIRVFDTEEGESDTTGVPPSFGDKKYDELLSIQYARMVRDAGAQLLCVHGRTREMKGQRSGLANLSLIRAMRAALDGSIPVLSNGNVLGFPDVLRAIEETECEGHMCAEPLLWDPTLFANPTHPVPSGRLPCGADKAARLAGVRTALDYVRWLRTYPVGIGFVKAHLFKMCFHSYELHIEFREALGKLRTSARAAAASAPLCGDQGNLLGKNDECACVCAEEMCEEEEEEEFVSASVPLTTGDNANQQADAIEAHLRALLAAEEACDVDGEQPKTALAEKKAAKAQIVDVFEEEGDLCINF